MTELPRQSNSDDVEVLPGKVLGMRRHLVEIVGQPPGVEFYIEAEDFGAALDQLNNLEFIELRTRGTGRNDDRRMAVHHTRVIGLYDPDWESLPGVAW